MSVPLPLMPLRELLLALADDEFVTGYTNSEWTGIAPLLEEDLAFSSLAQDELGHARALYELVAELSGTTADAIAYGRDPGEFRHARLVERPRGDWAYSVSRQFLYDTADQVRLDSLLQSTYTPLAQVAASIVREEKYHVLHATTWLTRLAEGSPEARRRQQQAFEMLWPDALGCFEPVAGEGELVRAGILPEPFAVLQQRWLERIAVSVRQNGLPFPFAELEGRWAPRIRPEYGGRLGRHSADFAALYDTMTCVYRLDPEATW